MVVWKSYSKKENIYKSVLLVQNFEKLIRLFYKYYSKKLTATCLLINSAPPITRSTIKLIKLIFKWKQGQSTNNANKKTKNWAFVLNPPLKFFPRSLTSHRGVVRISFNNKMLVFVLKLHYEVKKIFSNEILFNNYPHLWFFLLNYPSIYQVFFFVNIS